jgi:hypothetical protein
MGGSHQGVTSNPRLILGPNPASPGSVVTVSGFDFPRSQPVKVYFQDPSHGVVNAATNDGGFFNAGMKLPDHINGGSRVYAVSGSVTSFIPLQVMKPSLMAVNNPLSQDGTDVINGKGFLANSLVTLALSHGSSRINEGSVKADRLGQISSNIALPDMFLGTQSTLVASDTAHNTAFFTISKDPPIRVSPRAAHIGTSVTVSGRLFAKNEPITVYLQGEVVATGETSPSGRFQVSFNVPADAVRGTDTVTVKGATGDSGTATLTVNANSHLLVAPPSGAPGSTIHITGGSFVPGHTVNIVLEGATNNSSAPMSMGTATAQSDGTINVYKQVPSNAAPGHYEIVAEDPVTGTMSSTSFNVR